MKKSLLLLTVTVLLTLSLHATVLTVSNDPAGGAQYSTLLDAYNAAINGDTLMLEGTNIDYSLGSVSWAKSLAVIGIGFNPQKQNPRRSRIVKAFNYENNVRLENGGSGSKFYGIEFVGIQYNRCVILGANCSNYIFENCRFASNIEFNNQTAFNFIFKNCIFDNNNNPNITFSSSAANTNIVITNCVFDGYLQGNSNQYISLVVEHSLFLSTSQVPFQNLQYATIRNCVFMNYATIQSGTSSDNSYNNNIARLGALPTGPGSSGNFDNTDPLFTTYTAGQLYSTGHNYKLQAVSPGVAAGTDGTDIGVHGGFSSYSASGEVLIVPIMREVIILNTTVQPNGTINVQVNATKPNDN